MEEKDTQYANLVTQNQPILFSYILSLHPRKNQAKDILQETNIILWKKMDQFELGTNFKAWAFRIAFLQTRQWQTQQTRGGWLSFNNEIGELISDDATEILEHNSERTDSLKACIRSLKPKEQDLIKLRYLDEQSIADIADQKRKTIPSLKQAFFRIRKQLRSCIERKLASKST